MSSGEQKAGLGFIWNVCCYRFLPLLLTWISNSIWSLFYMPLASWFYFSICFPLIQIDCEKSKYFFKCYRHPRHHLFFFQTDFNPLCSCDVCFWSCSGNYSIIFKKVRWMLWICSLLGNESKHLMVFSVIAIKILSHRLFIIKMREKMFRPFSQNCVVIRGNSWL